MNLRNYLPTEKYGLVTHLRAADVSQRIADSIEPKTTTLFPMYSTKGRTKPYEGEVMNNTFTITRIIDYKNSFLPVVTGQISARSTGAYIAITMNLPVFAMIFMAMWLGSTGIICVSLSLAGLYQFRQSSQSEFTPVSLLPFGMFIVGYGLTMIAFSVESRRAKRFLAELLEGQEIN